MGADLLGRSRELATVQDLVATLAGGEPGALLIEGQAGIGKTSLLDAAKTAAGEAGVRVLSARGGEFERDLPFGMALQLFEPVIAGASGAERRALLNGAAGLAAPALGIPSASPADAAPFAALHGLYWLCANLAEREPVLVCIDDLHWSDEETVSWLSYLVRRMEGLAIGLLLAARPAEPGSRSPLVSALVTESRMPTLTVGPLEATEGTAYARQLLGDGVDDEFAVACHGAAQGNPLLISELARNLRQKGIRGAASEVHEVTALGPETIARATIVRLGRLGPQAIALARVAAILEPGTSVAVAAEVAGMESSEAAALADALTDAFVFAADAGLEFAHPVLRTSVHADTAPALLEELHARAAAVLHRRGANPEAIAHHVLATPAKEAAQFTGVLRAAAGSSARRGAPGAATRLLRRALEEAQGDERIEVLCELGTLEADAGDPAGIAHLREAVIAEDAPAAARGRAAKSLAHALAPLGRGHELTDVIPAELLEEVRAVDAELALRIEAELVSAGAMASARRAWSGTAERLAAATVGEREILGAMALTALSLDESRALGRRAVGDGMLLPDQLGSHSMVFYVLLKLIYCGELELVDTVLDELISDATTRVAFVDIGRYRNLQAVVAQRTGRLVEAAAEARTAFEIALQGGWDLGVATSLSAVLDALRERGEWEAGEAALAEARLDGRNLAVGAPVLAAARARFELAAGDAQAALARLRDIEPLAAAAPILEVCHLQVRPSLSAILAARGEAEQARALADEAVRAAYTWGEPRGIGIALIGAGLARGGEAGTRLLDQAATTLAGVDPVEEARARLELGAALRRSQERAASRAPLRAALDLAERHGATVLAGRAQEELRATGARPRRLLLTGLDSLTASEFRVAKLAAEGRSNPEIAQILFVSRKTVETHMSRVLQKLEISSRDELPGVLSPGVPAEA